MMGPNGFTTEPIPILLSKGIFGTIPLFDTVQTATTGLANPGRSRWNYGGICMYNWQIVYL